MGLHARLNAKSARFVGGITLASAFVAAVSWGILSALFIALAGIVLLTRDVDSARGLRGVLSGFAWWALITIGIMFSPVVG